MKISLVQQQKQLANQAQKTASSINTENGFVGKVTLYSTLERSTSNLRGEDSAKESNSMSQRLSSPSESNQIPELIKKERGISAIRDMLCPVCDVPRTGSHYYYGAQVCVSCRGFFKRSVQSGHYNLFKCSSLENCKINSKNWKSCKYCRFKKCLNSGMQTKYVMTNKEREERLVQKMEKPSATALRSQFTLGFQFSMEEENELVSTCNEMCASVFGGYYDFFGKHKSELAEMLSDYLTTNTVSNKTFTITDNLEEKFLKKHFFNCPDMQDLSPFDRMTLIGWNYQKLRGINWMFSFMGPDISLFLAEFYNYGLKNQADPNVAAVWGIIQQMLGASQKSMSIIVNEWESRVEEHPSLQDQLNMVIKVSNWFRSGPDNHINVEKYVLMTMICMFSQETLGLENSAKVADLQNKYVWKLHRYLYTKSRDRASKLLHEGLMLPPFVHDVFQKHLKDVLFINSQFESLALH